MSETIAVSELSTPQQPCPPPDSVTLSATRVGVLTFLCSEAVFFATLLIAYVTYRGATLHGPTPETSLSLPLAILDSVFLLSSSVAIGLAVKAFDRSDVPRFTRWMLVTIVLGSLFLCGTAYEWYQLIVHDGLTISRNLFGTTFFTLIGFHAAHVTIGLGVMSLLLWKRRRGDLAVDSEAPEMVSWYWHLVDTVWIVIVLVVYL
ncbi:cytochrome c oxidase subunit 3 [Allorhodopirellula heiligendammensis]|uniref:Cytochrome bo(3) ubiquinol oxidase subunit 3 n=1 Tax=Allorhodopirellula heiligendammensis TaxID=2714739 RepID=A0A5C6BHQ1_9BACT|nr:heme-copper oxidase subunit III [Allorhodopirellula heiligendammensis]TWU10856.1 Cytochrome c oxidase subunit 3 [Allorhodopirellula heiligendammensis]